MQARHPDRDSEVYPTVGHVEPGHIGVCPIDRGPLFFARSLTGFYALCRERHLFSYEAPTNEVVYDTPPVVRAIYGRLTRLKGAKGRDVRGW